MVKEEKGNLSLSPSQGKKGRSEPNRRKKGKNHTPSPSPPGGGESIPPLRRGGEGEM